MSSLNSLQSLDPSFSFFLSLPPSLSLSLLFSLSLQVVLVFHYASWCGTCTYVWPQLSSLVRSTNRTSVKLARQAHTHTQYIYIYIYIYPTQKL